MLATTVEGNVFRLSGELDVYAVADLHHQLKERLGALPVAFELAGVERIDGAGAQLLLWAYRQHAAKGLPFELKSVSDAVRDALAFIHFPALPG